MTQWQIFKVILYRVVIWVNDKGKYAYKKAWHMILRPQNQEENRKYVVLS